jgi:tRNA nucleotidyltransferase (CCA-adding enzyme)
VNPSTLRRIINSLSTSAQVVCRTLHDAGYETFVVGGAVRDLVRLMDPDDYDLATSATPEQITKLFRRVIPTGIEHGTVTVLVKEMSIEVTTFRTESGYSDGRHPDAVDFGVSIDEDLSRRDFTINGMALDPIDKRFLDPFGGEQDLRTGIIRAIGDPDERFAEDALRLLRAIRFAAQLEFTIEDASWQALIRLSESIERVAPERVRDEVKKILQSRRPSLGFRLMRDSELLAHILPELAAGVGVEQRGEHRYDVFEHSIRTCDETSGDSLVIRLAALLHDVAKPATLSVDEHGNRTFHGHDQASSDQVEALLKRLRFPNTVISKVSHLVRHHMFHYTTDWTDAAVRRFLARVGPENVAALFALREADSFAQRGARTDLRGLVMFRERIAAVLAGEHALSRNDLAVNGHDLVSIDIPPGRAMGTVIDHLFETVLDDPTQNTRTRLLTIARSFYDSRLNDSGESETGGR